MEISTLTNDCIKIKGKNSLIVIDPLSLKNKIEADAVLLLSDNSDGEISKVQGSRVLIKGPGDYEVSGIRISATRVGTGISYGIHVDGVSVFLTTSENIEKLKERANEYSVIVLQVNSDIDQSAITTLESNVVIFYGEKASQLSIGSSTKTAKYATTAEKLPKEMELVLLNSN